MAQAAVNPAELGIARVDFSQWQATHAGPTELDGLPVLAALEKVENKIEIPAFLAEGMNTLVPLAPATKKEYRLVIVAMENPALRASYPLESATLNVDGVNRFALVSPQSSAEFQFQVIALEDGTLQVSYTRDLGQTLEQGQFQLAPMAQILQK
jgi:hypothetical protein